MGKQRRSVVKSNRRISLQPFASKSVEGSISDQVQLLSGWETLTQKSIAKGGQLNRSETDMTPFSLIKSRGVYSLPLLSLLFSSTDSFGQARVIAIFNKTVLLPAGLH